MSLSDGAARAAILKTLADDVAAAVTGGKAELQRGMEALKVRSVTAELADGTEVATLTRAGGKPSPRITDPGKFLAWAQEAHPSETEVIVRPGYAEALLKAMKAAGRAVDPKTGEMVPGVEFADTAAYVTVTFAKGGVAGREQIRRAWRDGLISLPDVLDGLALSAPAPEPEADATFAGYASREALEADLGSALIDGGSVFTDAEGRFRSPEAAAAHAIRVQGGGFSTPAREARRMLADAAKAGDMQRAAMARDWLVRRGLTLEGDDEPGPVAANGGTP